jgi:hypothetical protein
MALYNRKKIFTILFQHPVKPIHSSWKQYVPSNRRNISPRQEPKEYHHMISSRHEILNIYTQLAMYKLEHVCKYDLPTTYSKWSLIEIQCNKSLQRHAGLWNSIARFSTMLCVQEQWFLLAETMPYQQRGQYLQPNYRSKVYTWPSRYHTHTSIMSYGMYTRCPVTCT